MDRKEWRLLQRVRRPPEGLSLPELRSVFSRSGFLVEQFLGRFGDQLCALARTAFEKQQALAEDEAIEQESLRVGLLRCETRRAVEFADVLQPRGIDAWGRGGRRSVGT